MIFRRNKQIIIIRIGKGTQNVLLHFTVRTLKEKHIHKGYFDESKKALKPESNLRMNRKKRKSRLTTFDLYSLLFFDKKQKKSCTKICMFFVKKCTTLHYKFTKSQCKQKERNRKE